MRMAFLCPVVVALLVVVGCGKPKLDQSYDSEVSFSGTEYTIDPIKSEQKIKVNGTATAPVDVFIYLQKNKDAADKEIVSRKYSAIILAKQEKTPGIALEATIPANEAAIVRVSSVGIKSN